MVDKIVGYDVRNRDRISNEYICQICNLLLRDPVQLVCGHRLCQLCFNNEYHSVIKCLLCSVQTSFTQVSLDRNCQDDMSILDVTCYFCNWNGIFQNYPTHLSLNHTQLSCEYCQRKCFTMKLYLDHQSECEQMLINCPLKSYGCTESFIRMNMKTHFLSEKHQYGMSNLFHPISNSTNNQSIKSSSNLNQTINSLFDNTQNFNNDIQIQNCEYIHHRNFIDHTSKDLTTLKISIEETNESIQGFEINQQILIQDLTSLKQMIENEMNTSYDGTLLWKIDNVQEKMINAQNDRQTSIYSPSFYSSPTGYHMRLRLYLNGDGNARRTHLSIFFVLMRGEYDLLLKFPFSFRVTFCLYDQTNQQKHIIDSFQPNIQSASFQRPQLQMNIASGIPKFYPLTLLRQLNNPYIRNDTMFIKVVVHFNEISRQILPSIFQINHGLPSTISQMSIQEFIDKQNQELKSN